MPRLGKLDHPAELELAPVSPVAHQSAQLLEATR
jgi:hypothetical protein